MSNDARKADAYHKITLGGLVIKAGLGDADKALLLGLLIDGAARIKDPDEAQRLRTIGDAAFKEHRHGKLAPRRLGPPQ